MAKVVISESKLNNLADAISGKSGENEPLTIDEMTDAVLGIELPKHQSKDVSITPSETAQSQTVLPDSGYNGLSDVDVNVSAIPSDYVGSGVTRRYSADLTASGKTVTAPAGYYANSASKSVATGSAGTPTATKGTVNNHSVSVTPKVTNTTGYITGGTKTGTAVSVTAAELVSGDKSITSAGTEDVTNYATATVTAGSATMPASLSGTGSISGALNNTMSVLGTATGTPQVNAGYISSGTSGSTSIALQVSTTTKNATTYNPQSTDREIAAGTYLIGKQTIKGAPLQNKTVTSNGDVNADAGYYGLDTVTVNVPSSTPTLEAVAKSYTPTETAQSETVTPGTGYDGLSSVDISVGAISSTYVGSGITQRTSSDLTESGATVTAPSGYYANSATKTIASGSATPPEVNATGASVTSNGSNLLTLSKVISLTPQVTAGYIASGTAANRNVVLSASVPTLGATTYNASSTDQTIAAGTYINGAQTIKGYTNQSKTFTANGTYTPDTGYNGFDSVTVNVSGGASNWTKLGSAELTVNTTSTSAASAGTISCGSTAWDKDAIIWVRVRDKAGKREGYCAGSDAYFMNFNPANSSTSNFATPAVLCYRYTTGSQWAATAGQYGVYGYSISSAGVVTIRRRYNSNYSLTINGTFSVEVYKLTYPANSGPAW